LSHRLWDSTTFLTLDAVASELEQGLLHHRNSLSNPAVGFAFVDAIRWKSPGKISPDLLFYICGCVVSSSWTK
jgi:hypothetical protein